VEKFGKLKDLIRLTLNVRRFTVVDTILF